MKNFKKLKKLVRTGQVIIYYELSIPRSNSTSWQIALTEAPEIDGQINEPSFDRAMKPKRYNEMSNKSSDTQIFEEYCGRILERLIGNSEKGKIGLLTKVDKRPVGLIVNDLVHSVSADILKPILNLTNNIAITIRDPLIQGYSALTRSINDILDSPGGGNITPKVALYLANKTSFAQEEVDELVGPGKDKVNPATILAGLKLPVETQLSPLILQQAIKVAIDHTNDVYLSLCWDNLKHQLATIYEQKPNAQLIILDGTDLLKDPENIMKQSSQALGVSYTSNMIDKWQKGTKENFYCCITEGWGELAFSNHWNGPVRNSTGFEIKSNSITDRPEVQQFPATMQLVLEKCVETYQNIASSEKRIKLGLTDSVEEVLLSIPSFTPIYSTTEVKAKEKEAASNDQGTPVSKQMNVKGC